jgi:hypothetical protein
MTTQDLGVQEGVKDILNEIIEYEPECAVPNIDDHVFDLDNYDYKHNGDDDIIAVEENGIAQAGQRPCLVDLVELGWRKLHEMNINMVGMVAKEQTRCKRMTMQYIMQRVSAMKEESIATTIPPELDKVEEGDWVTYLRQLRFNYYD